MPNLTRTQSTGLSCGAACLLVAARELGIQSFTIPPQVINATVSTPSRTLNFGTDPEVDIEKAIYNVTARHKNGYSMPADIGKCAKFMGLDPTVHMSGCIVPKALLAFYPDAAAQCATEGVPVVGSDPGALTSTQRQLCAVGMIGGLHWVLYRPDGTYMDPASGENFNYFVSLGQGPGYLIKYIDTGIYIVVDSAAGVAAGP